MATVGSVLAVLGILYIVYRFFFKKSAPVGGRDKYALPVDKRTTGAARAAQAKSNSDGRPQPTGPRMLVAYGSQTGTAEGFAQTLHKEALGRNFNAHLLDLDEFDQDTFVDEPLVLLLTATYGEGEPTDNARDFHRWLENDAEPGCLNNTKFSVFGLGNRQYEQFNAMGRFFDAKMEAAGAERIYERGEGDDDGTLEDDFSAWKEEMWSAVTEAYGLADNANAAPTFSYKLSAHSGADETVAAFKSKSHGKVDAQRMREMTVLKNYELHSANSGRSCRHVEVDLNGTGFTYVTGDHIGVMPVNHSDQVERLVDRMGVDPKMEFSLTDSDNFSPFPCPCTVETALSRYVEINGAVKKSLLGILSHFAQDESEASRLKSMSKKEGKADFDKFISKGHRGICDVLEAFPSVNIPLGNLLESLPRLQPRFYSISSSSKLEPGLAAITAVVVKEAVEGGRTFRGVCTHTLLDAAEGSKVQAFIRTSTFKLPKALSTPCVMVGAGTGLAPLRGFVRELSFQRNNGKDIGQNILVFGCQNSQHDYLYREELENAESQGIISNLFLAFSREQKKKVYVQDRVRENAEMIWQLLSKQRGFLYICGGTSMAKGVRAALTEEVSKLEGITIHKAEERVQSLVTENRFHQDVWS